MEFVNTNFITMSIIIAISVPSFNVM